ncbi:MAG: DNA-processing protein DprA [Rikenellaceae bacterium]|nr:DNA-processing protein DprA [Rikenellaceae bacterium]
MIIYDIALTMIPEIGNIRGRRLIEAFGNAETAMKTCPEDIVRQTQIPVSAIEKMMNNRVFPDAEAEIKFAEKNGIRIISIASEEYPKLLRECCDAPLVLYVKGDMDFNGGHWLSIVGTRKFTSYGERITREIITGLSETTPDAVIVSGLAYGTDICAHNAAMDAGLRTVAVLGNPLNHIYPSAHTKYAERIIGTGGAIISEFHSKCAVQPNNFLRRNRIIAGISSGSIIIESAYKGGSLSTANYAHGYDRDVMAVPGRVGDPMSEGTNNLLYRQKAYMVRNASDVIEVMNWDIVKERKIRPREPELFSKSKNENMTPEMRIIYECLAEDPRSFDDLSVMSNMPVYKISFLLFEMELAGLIKIMPGNMAVKN